MDRSVNVLSRRSCEPFAAISSLLFVVQCISICQCSSSIPPLSDTSCKQSHGSFWFILMLPNPVVFPTPIWLYYVEMSNVLTV